MNKLKKIRIEKSMTQKELAEKSGITRQSINNIENGKQYPTYFNIIKLAAALEINLEDLF